MTRLDTRPRCTFLGGGYAVGVALSLALIAQTQAQQPTDLPADTDPALALVTVNGEDITESDLRVHQVNALRQRARRPTTDAEFARVIADVTPGALAEAIDQLLMVQKARALGYTFTENLFQQFLLNARGVFRFPEQTEDFNSNDEVLRAIQESEGLTEREVRRMIERQLLAQRAMEIEVLHQVSLTEAEAREYYDANIEAYTTPATAALREILLAVPRGARGPADQDAKVKAEALVARLRSGEDFATLATEVSDSPSKQSGGRVGPFLETEFAEPMRALIATLDVGQIADPIRTPLGYQIVMLDFLVDAYVRPFEELREEITNSVFGDRRTDAYNALLTALRNDAVIEWHHDDLRQAYEVHRASNPEVHALPIQ